MFRVDYADQTGRNEHKKGENSIKKENNNKKKDSRRICRFGCQLYVSVDQRLTWN